MIEHNYNPTLTDEPSLDIYLREIGKYRLLSPAQEIELAKRARSGDREAMDQLTEGNLRFVVSVAKEFQHRGLSLADLINEGNVGLLKAVQHFDAAKGCRFSTYALWWIRQAILKALAQQTRTIRLPMNRIDKLNKIYKAIQALRSDPKRMGAPPSLYQIAKAVKMTVEEVTDLLGNSSNQVSLDAPMSTDGELRLSETLEGPALSPEAVLKNKTLAHDIKTALSVLTPREEKIVRMYYGLDVDEGTPACRNSLRRAGTLDSIGRKLSISRERVRQIRDRALKKIKVATQSGRLRAYLD